MRFTVSDYKTMPVERSPRLMFGATDSPEAIYQFYREHIASAPEFEHEKEHVIVITMSARLQPTGWNLVSLGSLSEATCHPREVFRPVITKAAHAFVMLHNHPSGDPSPSQADIEITSKMKACADMLMIPMLDHVIIGEPAPGRPAYYSFRETCLL